ncbi:MAG: SDR family NAD(P)-dependent oxidoreductase [Pseudomonadota bacterium]
MLNLTGTTALVTGGARGIGAAIVHSLAQAGAKVILHFNQSRGAAEKLAAAQPAGHCVLVQADLSAARAADALWRQARTAIDGDPIHLLVNNAAIMPAAGIDDPLDAWDAAWREVCQVNLIACADLCRAAITDFRSLGGGKIVNIASRAGHRGDAPDYLHYGASKGGLLALTKGIARGFAKDNILAFAIAPGFTKTDMARGFIAAHGAEAAVRDIPLGEMASPQEIGALVAFLASAHARHLTGATFDINGASYVR